MNRKQKIVIWVAIVVIALMVVFPPVGDLLVTLDIGNTPVGQSVVTGCIASYGFIFKDYGSIKCDLLFIQLIVVVFVAVGFTYVLRGQKDKDAKR